MSEQHDTLRAVPPGTKPLHKANFALVVKGRAQKVHLCHGGAGAPAVGVLCGPAHGCACPEGPVTPPRGAGVTRPASSSLMLRDEYAAGSAGGGSTNFIN